MARKNTKGASSLFYNIEKLIQKLPIVGKVYNFVSKAISGFLDALSLRPLALTILILLTGLTAFSTIATYSFYGTCNKEVVKNKMLKGDFEQLATLDKMEVELETAILQGDLNAEKSLEGKIEHLKFRNKFSKTGAKVGYFFCNELFGYGAMVLFLAAFTILYLYHQRVYFPNEYSWQYALSRSLLYGLFILGGLTLWVAVVAHLVQDYAHEKPPLLWGGAIGKQTFNAVKGAFGTWGLGAFLVLLPAFYGFILSVIRISPEEKARRKAKKKAEEKFNQKQKEREEKERQKEIERKAKLTEQERLAELEEEAQKKAEEEERKQREEAERLAEETRKKEEKRKRKEEQGESTFKKVLRGLRGLFTIGSGTIEGEIPEEEQAIPQECQEPEQEVVQEVPEVQQEVPSRVVPKVQAPKAEEAQGGGKVKVEDRQEDKDILKPNEIQEVVVRNYIVPSVELLEDHGRNNEKLDSNLINENAQRIIDELAKFGIEVSVPNATVGPTITLYELKLGSGVRISKVSNLDDDIAMALKVEKVRIIAPLPGRGTVGVEVPNPKVQTVSMRSMIASSKFNEAKSKMQLPIAIGKTITNETFVFDLAKTPHLLIAGATGQGKSVGLNALITSLLYSKTPDEVKLVMVDPKMLEFAVYEGISQHFLIKTADADKAIITDMTKVMPTLKSLCEEMDDRYQRLSDASVRNIVEYNSHIKEGKLSEEDGHIFLPYIVVIIDEFADLMMTAASARKEVELLISRLAQKARAAGIHLVMATQRPSTDVITGLIKANFPARIAFRVFSQIDSRTILDGSGANQLIGRGDMLYYSGQNPQRVQCAFVDTPEIERVVEHISTQPKPLNQIDLPECPDEEGEEFDAGAALTKIDPLLKEVARMVVETRVGSTSNIQRRFEVGYNKAGRIMDQMQALGIVGPQQGSKPREVLIYDLVELDDLFISKGI